MKESMIPASPLVEEHDVPLARLYVQPPISAFTELFAFGQGEQPKASEKKLISSYAELFIKDDKVPYKNIYVEANAGYGKTSFTQKLAMTWCRAQSSDEFIDIEVEQEEVNTLKHFDLLFLLHLRDFRTEDTCLLDKLILKFIWENLPRKEHYSRQFIERMFQNKPCLVILDGLDEWVYPETCTQKPGIPHNNFGENCTVLCTTRPWKLSAIGLPQNLIDRHVEISELDTETSNNLKTNAFKLLCENSGEKERDLKDFNRKVESVKLGDIRLIPYILLQLICIWFDGLSIGTSKCETYSNTIELTLERGLKKKNAQNLPTANPEHNVSVPECMRNNELCNQYVNLLLKLGKLAFNALFQKIKETSLVIDSKTVLKFLKARELEFCLKIGLLSQSKDSNKVSVGWYKVYFQHKSIQEFMAALYITSEWKNGTITSTTLDFFTSLSSIIEMENLFIFVCGMNPEVYTCISGELQRIVDLGGVMRRYTNTMNDENAKTIRSYHSMQMQCLEENMKNENGSCPIYLYVVLNEFLTVDLTALKTSIHFNKCHLKSLLLSYPDKDAAAFMNSLYPGVFTTLETLRVERCYTEPVWLANILTESASTLQYLRLSLGFSSLSDIILTATTGLTCLQSLYLDRALMTHSNLKCIYAYINHTTTLAHLKLMHITCLDHWTQYRDCDVNLDLSSLNKLESVELRCLHMSSAAWQKLLLSVGGLPLPVIVELSFCGGPSMLEWKTIVNVLESTPTLLVSRLHDFSISKSGSASLTLKKTIPVNTRRQNDVGFRLDVGDLNPTLIRRRKCDIV